MAAMLVGVRRQLLLMYKFSKRYAANLPETWPITVCSVVSMQVFSQNLARVFLGVLICYNVTIFSSKDY